MNLAFSRSYWVSFIIPSDSSFSGRGGPGHPGPPTRSTLLMFVDISGDPAGRARGVPREALLTAQGIGVGERSADLDLPFLGDEDGRTRGKRL